ncbi:hypothetical protein BX666DRAFT_1584683 [Dichotomocladium elegans]|nr:hypothetical protein BX666DRAFT_1584683 [Dichotomocladium elegans]
MKIPPSRTDIQAIDMYCISLHVLEDAFILVDPQGHALCLPFADGGNVLTPIKTPFEVPKDARSYQLYGVVGILEGVRENYLIVITRVQVLGKIFGHPVSVINQVACIRFDARKAQEILDAKVKAVVNRSTDPSDSEESDSEDEATDRIASAVAAQNTSVSPPSSAKKNSTEEQQEQPMMTPYEKDATAPVITNANTLASLLKSLTPKATNNNNNSTFPLNEEIALDKKIVRQVNELFSRSMFIYSPGYVFSIRLRQHQKR